MALITILADQRCGSNLCEKIMHKHGIQSKGEIFIFKEEGGLRDKICKEKDNPIDFLKKIKRNHVKTDFSIRVMHCHFSKYPKEEIYKKIKSICLESDYIIVLERKDKLAQYASFLTASITNKWISFASKNIQEKPIFNKQSYEKYVKQKNNTYKIYKSCLEGFDNVHYITYEELVENISNINYIIPKEWKIKKYNNKSIKLPIKQSKNKKIWNRFENSKDVFDYLNRGV